MCGRSLGQARGPGQDRMSFSPVRARRISESGLVRDKRWRFVARGQPPSFATCRFAKMRGELARCAFHFPGSKDTCIRTADFYRKTHRDTLPGMARITTRLRQALRTANNVRHGSGDRKSVDRLPFLSVDKRFHCTIRAITTGLSQLQAADQLRRSIVR